MRLYNFGLGFISFSIIAALAIVIFQIAPLYSAKKSIRFKTYKIAEGFVENFKAMPYEGHASEKFDVAGIHFEFSDYDLGNIGYHNAVSHGGIVKHGRYVRITYATIMNRRSILKLEVKK